MTMIEKVTIAISDSIINSTQNGQFDDMSKNAAKAAIEAMRDIDDDVLDAGAYDLDMTLRTQWTNIIDAALKED